MAARREARARFKSSSDLIHRLFVCISGQCFLSGNIKGLRYQAFEGGGKGFQAL